MPALLPSDLIRQLQEKPVLGSFQVRPVECLITLQRAAIAQKGDRPRGRLEGGEQVHSESVEVQLRLRKTADVEGLAASWIDQGNGAVGAILSDGPKEERTIRLILELKPRNRRSGELGSVQMVEAEH